MDTARDLRLVLLALGDGLIDPERLSAAAREWSPDNAPFLEFLAARGWITTGQLLKLEAVVGGAPTPDLVPGALTAAEPVAASEQPTPTLPGTIDRGSTAPPTGGRYRVTDLYRSGGLGRVWRAEDTALGRMVALKTLRPDRAGDPRLQARFVDEARITGQLEHPCIVPVYDLLANGAGGAAGPCYAMRFVAGRTLAEAARDYHDRRAAGTASRLDLAALLDAFVAVCRAVAYAHARKVLHRDLKGQNIVLGEYGEVFVLDWGLAKVVGGDDGPAAVTPSPVGPRDATATGAVLGTPAFMAPELADNRAASVASDVYALGGILYVILTGRPPYDGSGVDSVLDRVLAAPPPPPRMLNPDAPPGLEAVCRKAMCRDAGGRYPTADALAADVRAWLADEPVGAYPERWPTRLGRWGRRHRPAVLGAAGVLVTAVIALAVSTWLVWQGERRTAEQRDLADAARNLAEQRLSLARGLSVDLRKLSEERLADVPNAATARREFLADALATYRAALVQQPDDPDLQQEVAWLARYVGNLCRLTGPPFGPAESCYVEAARLYQGLAAARPDDPDRQNLVAETFRDQAQLLTKMGRLRDAVAILDRAAKAADGLPADYQLTLATILLDRAGVEADRGGFDAAGDYADQAAGLFRRLLALPKAQQPQYARMFLATALCTRATAERELKHFDKAVAIHTEALEHFQALSAAGPDPNEKHFGAWAALERARTVERRGTDRPAAEPDYTSAIKAWDTLARDFNDTPFYRRWLGTALAGRGALRADVGRQDDAAADLDRALSIAEQLVGSGPKVPDYHVLLGLARAGQARLAAARRDAAAVTDWRRKAAAAFHTAAGLAPENAEPRRALADLERQSAPTR